MSETAPQASDPGPAIGGEAPDAQQADPLGPVALVSYAHGDHAERHRRIMRVFYLNKTRDIGLQLSPSQVADRLRTEFGYTVDADSLTSALETLSKNGALRGDQDIRDVRSAPEFRRKNMLYDITPAGELFEQFLIAHHGLRDEIGELDASRLLSIRDALARISVVLASEDDGGDVALHDLLDQAAKATADLRQGATSYMSRLNEFTVSSSHSIEDFQAARDGIVSYLQGFHRDLRRYDDAIAGHLASIAGHDPQRLAQRIVTTRTLPAPMGGLTEDDMRNRAVAEQLARWTAIEQWFGAAEAADSPWRRLSIRVFDAVGTVIDIARRKIERGHDRRDRAHAWQSLALLVSDIHDEGAVQRAFAQAVGMRPPRHLSGLFGDHEALGRPQTVSWAGAGTVRVAAHLRQPGARRPGAGRPASVPVNRDLAARMRAQAARQAELRARLHAAITGADGPLRISDLHQLDPIELADLLAWVSRAFATERTPDGSRQATSPDGLLTLRLILPHDNARTRLHADHGALDLPDYRIEVVR